MSRSCKIKNILGKKKNKVLHEIKAAPTDSPSRLGSSELEVQSEFL